MKEITEDCVQRLAPIDFCFTEFKKQPVIVFLFESPARATAFAEAFHRFNVSVRLGTRSSYCYARITFGRHDLYVEHRSTSKERHQEFERVGEEIKYITAGLKTAGDVFAWNDMIMHVNVTIDRPSASV